MANGFANGGIIAAAPQGSDEVPLFLSGGCDYILPSCLLRDSDQEEAD